MAGAKKSHFRRWLVILVILGGVAAGGVAYVKRPKDPDLDFKTAQVTHGEITQVVTANGALNPVRTVTVGSQISGIITELKVDFNSKVREGEVLAKIDPATYERALARAVADLANAQAGLELAKFNAKQSKQLYADKLISESEFEQNEVGLQQADANVKIRQASVDSAKVDLDRTTIFAPISGMVISRKVDAGQKRVNFTVDAFPGRKFSGRVNQVRFAPVTNQNVVNYATVVEVDNKDLKLRPGMTANATIITAQRTNIFYIPNSALRFRPPDDAVIGSTNVAVAEAAGTNAPAAKSDKKSEVATSGPFAGLPIPPWQAGGERRRPTDQERSDYENSLTPTQKEKYRQVMAEMRARFAQRSQGDGAGGTGAGGPGGGGGFGMMSGGGRSGAQNDGPAIRKVYLLDKERSTPSKPVLSVVSVKTGISDGSNTEVQEGLKEGDVVITSTATSSTTAAAGPPVNPFAFGGGRRR